MFKGDSKMRSTVLFPYQNPFIKNCYKVQHLSKYSIEMIISSITNFWRYYSRKFPNNPNIANVAASDIRDYLIQLDQKEHLSKKTINKYLSYFKKYFIFLTTNNFIASYPLFDLKGISVKRKETIIINWMSQIPNFINKKNIHPETIKLLILISLGYDLDQLLNIKLQDISAKLNNPVLKNFLYNNLNFDKTTNPYIFQGQRVDKFNSLDSITSKVKYDQKLLKFPITPRKLRQSYILSIISNQNLSDKKLLSILHISPKSLSYYKFCANYYNLVSYKD